MCLNTEKQERTQDKELPLQPCCPDRVLQERPGSSEILASKKRTVTARSGGREWPLDTHPHPRIAFSHSSGSHLFPISFYLKQKQTNQKIKISDPQGTCKPSKTLWLSLEGDTCFYLFV